MQEPDPLRSFKSLLTPSLFWCFICFISYFIWSYLDRLKQSMKCRIMNTTDVTFLQVREKYENFKLYYFKLFFYHICLLLFHVYIYVILYQYWKFQISSNLKNIAQSHKFSNCNTTNTARDILNLLLAKCSAYYVQHYFQKSQIRLQ